MKDRGYGPIWCSEAYPPATVLDHLEEISFTFRWLLFDMLYHFAEQIRPKTIPDYSTTKNLGEK
jgi:hypothetical protein